jgi:hypothetical protein
MRLKTLPDDFSEHLSMTSNATGRKSGHSKLKRKLTTMSVNLLILYEIADKAARVKSKKAYRDFEKWAREVITTYQDAAIEKVASMHLFRLKSQFSF